MTPGDAKALAELKAELQSLFDRGISVPGPHGHRLPWLIRVVDELDARVCELESGGIPEIIARHDARLAERDAQARTLVAKVAELEALKLPDPNVTFRKLEPADKVNGDAVSDSETIASRSDR